MAGMEFLRRFGHLLQRYHKKKSCGYCESVKADVHVYVGTSRVCLCGQQTTAEPEIIQKGIYRGRWKAKQRYRSDDKNAGQTESETAEKGGRKWRG